MTKASAVRKVKAILGDKAIICTRRFQGRITGYELLEPIEDSGCFNVRAQGATLDEAFAALALVSA